MDQPALTDPADDTWKPSEDKGISAATPTDDIIVMVYSELGDVNTYKF